MKIKNELRGLPEDAFSLNFGSTGESAHFYHANGFPLGIYEPLLSRSLAKLASITDAMWQEWKSCNKRTIFLENTRQGHLFPIENPQSCSELIHKGLAVLK